jgi:hypothetical protein
MIEILPQTSETCLVVHFSDKVSGQEYQRFIDAIEERLNTSEKVSLVCEFVGFDFYGDFESAEKDLKFGLKDYKHIRRAAFVGDQKWIKWFTRFIGPFTRAEEKHFPAGQLEAAVTWASA